MSFPSFFNEIPRIVLYDPLAEFLGAADGGLLEYGYDDAVRLAGHSCPTVAMAYALTVKGLKALYPQGSPERGAVRAHFPQSAQSGVTGVISSVVGLLTGATETTGFKGLGGRFARHGLMHFETAMPWAFRLQREADAEVGLEARMDLVPPSPRIGELLALSLTGQASAGERHEFQALWQERVRKLLVDHWDDPDLWRISRH